MTSNKGDKNLKREWNAASKLLLNKVLSRGIPASKYFSPCAKVSNSSNSVGRLSRRPLFFLAGTRLSLLWTPHLQEANGVISYLELHFKSHTT